MIPGIEGRHAYYPPGATSPAFTLGLIKTDAGVPIFPRVRLRPPLTLAGLGDAQDASDPIIGAPGEFARPAFRKGKTIAYSGFVEARSLADFRTLEDTLRAGMADQSAPGRIVASWHPLNALGSAKTFPARAMGLEIGDPLEAKSLYRATLVAAFRNHDGRYFEQLGSSVVRAINASGTDVAWPAAALTGSMLGPVNDIVTNQCTNPSGATVTTGWATTGATVTVFERIPLPDTSFFFEPIFDPPTTTALHAVTNGSAVAGNGVEFTRAVTSGSAVRFVAWIRNRESSNAAIELRILNAAGTLKATSAASAAADATWTRVEVTVTPDSTGNWKFRVCQKAGAACEWAWSSTRICPAIAMTLTPGFGPHLNLPSTWDAPNLHLDFENFWIVDDAGHDWSSLADAQGTWARNAYGAGSFAPTARADVAGPAIDPGIVMTLRWTPAYW